MELLNALDLSIHFPIYKGVLRRVVDTFKAVEKVSFSIEKGDVLAIIGESGSGKTTIGKTLLGLFPPTSGTITYDEKDISSSWFKGRIQAVFQNPYSSLNPRQNVLDIVSEPLRQSETKLSLTDVKARVQETLQSVGIDPSDILRYPHEFSGGQRQRISIARAIITHPDLIILDEPVSSLDVSIRAQILNLLAKLQKDYNLSYIYISHDLATVRFLAEKVLIIYKGRTMEMGDVSSIFANPANPYTRLLLRSAKDILIEKEDIHNEDTSAECPFYSRCELATTICKEQFPEKTEIKGGHYVYCHHAGD